MPKLRPRKGAANQNRQAEDDVGGAKQGLGDEQEREKERAEPKPEQGEQDGSDRKAKAEPAGAEEDGNASEERGPSAQAEDLDEEEKSEGEQGTAELPEKVLRLPLPVNCILLISQGSMASCAPMFPFAGDC